MLVNEDFRPGIENAGKSRRVIQRRACPVGARRPSVLRRGRPRAHLAPEPRQENAFSESDVRLLTTLAGSLSVALENARLVHETRQRNAELALINSVQRAIAGELDSQAIYDLVGDKLQEVFDAQVVSISVYDDTAGLLTFPYVIERGRRLEEEPIPLIGFRKHVIETREPLLIAVSTPEVAERYGNPYVLSGEPVKSAFFVPLIAGGKATGVVSLQNLDREDAFTDPDQRLLVTLCWQSRASLSRTRASSRRRASGTPSSP